MNPYKIAEQRFEGNLITPYQPTGVRWMMMRERHYVPGGILCDEMGLGKTAETIFTILSDPEIKQTLIVCPKSVLEQWAVEFHRFAPCLHGKVMIHAGGKRNKDPEYINQFKVVITTLGMIAPNKHNNNTELHRISWGRVVVDEAHDVRNEKSITFKFLNHLNAHIRWCLTGTPVFNKIADFVSLMKWIGVPQACVQSDMSGYTKTYVLRRTKEQVCIANEDLRLPECKVTNVFVDLNTSEELVYKEVFEDGRRVAMAMARAQNAAMYMMELIEKYLRCRQTLAQPKLVSLVVEHPYDINQVSSKVTKLLKMLATHPTEKTLIFCNFRGEMDAIHTAVNRKVYRIDGSVTQADRLVRVKEFNEDQTGAIFIIQIKAGGVGLNLQQATQVYIMSPAWNPATEVQAICRSHRTGQTQTVHVHRMIAQDVDKYTPSVEKRILQLQGAKSKFFDELMGSSGDMSNLPVSGCPDIDALKGMFDIKAQEELDEQKKQWRLEDAAKKKQEQQQLPEIDG